jgi:hypothetical protein
MDAYRKGLNGHDAAVANKVYKSHQKIGFPGDIITSLTKAET